MGGYKKNFELVIVKLMSEGYSPAQIAKKLNLSLPSLSYHLSTLKREGVIKKIGYGTWEVNRVKEVKISSHKGTRKVELLNRGHAFIWKVKTEKPIDWKKLLNEKGIDWTPKGIANTPRIIIDNKKVWLGKSYITIYEPKGRSFFGTNAIESKKKAILAFLDTMEAIKSFAGDFRYVFTCKRQHYGHIKNLEAEHFIRRGKKILIKGLEKGYWFTIDFSQNKYKEAELIHEKDALVDSLGYASLMNSHERTRFKVTPDFILKRFEENTELNNEITKRLKEQSERQLSITQVLEQMGGNITILTKEIAKLKYKE